MATTSINLDALNNKIMELDQKIADIKANESLAKNTRQTRSYNLRKEMHALEVIRAIATDNWSQEISEYFTQLTTLSADRVVYDKVVVNKGDSLMSLLQKYSNHKDVLNKIQKAAAEAGLTVNMDKGIIE